MYLTVKQQVKHLSKDEYQQLKELCHIAKNLANQAIYNIRQQYFENKTYLSYEKNYHLLKSSENFRMLNSNMAQQILKEVDGSFKSFFALLKKAKEGTYDFERCKLPRYLPKDGHTPLVIAMVRLKGNKLILPFSNSYNKTHSKITFTVPPILLNKEIKEIRIIPKSKARFFEIQYVYKADCVQRNLNKNHALALDLGVNNLVTAVTNTGNSFLLDGRKIKSINQWYNKENARLQSIKDHQRFGKKQTKRQQALLRKRNNLINDQISKAAKKVVDYCIKNDIGVLVVGYNTHFQKDTNIGRVNNQNFVNIPYGKLLDKLKYLCELNDIIYVEQEESYTSKASFWDRDPIPVYDPETQAACQFSGKRITRGLYRAADGRTLNADTNGALNILRKSNVVSLSALYARGEVDTPVRIRIA